MDKKYNHLVWLVCILYGIIIGITISIFILLIPPVSAFPLQLLQNGRIVDLGTNATINGSSVDIVYFNDSFYFIPKMNVTNMTNITQQNISYFNITNVTNISYGNITNVTNITWYNYTNCSFNYTYYNATGNYTYNKSEVDNLLTSKLYNRTEVDAIGNYILSTTTSGVNSLRTELTNTFNSTASNKDFIKSNTFYVVIGILAFILLVTFFILFNRE